MSYVAQDKRRDTYCFIVLRNYNDNFDVLPTVYLSIFISVFNQLVAQNLFHNKFYVMPLHVSSTCARNILMQAEALVLQPA
jgi:hypothetical protein